MNKQESTTDNDTQLLDKTMKIIEDKGINFLKSSKEYPKGIIITTLKKSCKFSPFSKISQIQEILFGIDNFKKENPHLLDGEDNLRIFKHKSNAIILFFKKSININKICKEAMQKDKVFKYSPYRGTPLDSRNNYSKIIVENADPNSNLEYYESFGTPIEIKNIRGRDIVTMEVLNPILPAIEEHAKWLKQGKVNKFFFYLNPSEDNKAAPMYCIAKRNYKMDNLHENLVKNLKNKFPRKKLTLNKPKVVEEKLEPQETPTPTKTSPKTPKKTIQKKKKKDDSEDSADSSLESSPVSAKKKVSIKLCTKSTKGGKKCPNVAIKNETFCADHRPTKSK